MAAAKREESSDGVWLARLIHAAGRRADPALQRFLRVWVEGMALPSEADVEDLVARQEGARDELSLEKVLQDFSDGAAAIDRQAAAQMTVGALSLTVVGLLGKVNDLPLIPVVVSALIGVVLAQFALLIFVGRTPSTGATMKSALVARTLFLRKFGLVTVSQLFIVLALIGAAMMLVFSV